MTRGARGSAAGRAGAGRGAPRARGHRIAVLTDPAASRRWRGALLTRVRAAAAAALAGRARTAEVTILLSGDDAVRRLNRRYRATDKPTNVLSFSAAGGPAPAGAPMLLGDVILAYDTIRREASLQGKTLADHVSHLVVHGVLHLLGYDHETDAGARRMESLETRILARLGIADPYAPARRIA